MRLEMIGSENKDVHLSPCPPPSQSHVLKCDGGHGDLCLDNKICRYMPYDKNRDINCWNVSYIYLRFGFFFCKY